MRDTHIYARTCVRGKTLSTLSMPVQAMNGVACRRTGYCLNPVLTLSETIKIPPLSRKHCENAHIEPINSRSFPYLERS